MFFSQILVEAGKLKAEFWKIGGVERNKRGREGGVMAVSIIVGK